MGVNGRAPLALWALGFFGLLSLKEWGGAAGGKPGCGIGGIPKPGGGIMPCGWGYIMGGPIIMCYGGTPCQGIICGCGIYCEGPGAPVGGSMWPGGAPNPGGGIFLKSGAAYLTLPIRTGLLELCLGKLPFRCSSLRALRLLYERFLLFSLLL